MFPPLRLTLSFLGQDMIANIRACRPPFLGHYGARFGAAQAWRHVWPEAVTNGFFRHVAHPSEGDLVMPDVLLRFSDSFARITRLPRFGEHGREILGELGLTVRRSPRWRRQASSRCRNPEA
jgi:crotonobetainyl-CoA:carnitine CoA-transferase CaiB-like acyl-CoA transferase